MRLHHTHSSGINSELCRISNIPGCHAQKESMSQSDICQAARLQFSSPPHPFQPSPCLSLASVPPTSSMLNPPSRTIGGRPLLPASCPLPLVFLCSPFFAGGFRPRLHTSLPDPHPHGTLHQWVSAARPPQVPPHPWGSSGVTLNPNLPMGRWRQRPCPVPCDSPAPMPLTQGHTQSRCQDVIQPTSRKIMKITTPRSHLCKGVVFIQAVPLGSLPLIPKMAPRLRTSENVPPTPHSYPPRR